MIRPDPFGDKKPIEDSATEQGSGIPTNSVRALHRHIAEARLRQSSATVDNATDAPSQEEAKRLLHELRVHQIELEMQNEALRESQIAIDAVRARYFDLYDLAPIAYCTVSEQGLIWQVNLSAASLFGLARNALLNQPFSRCIFVDDQDVYYLARRRQAYGGEPQSLELRLVRHGGEPFWAALTLAIAQDAAGKREVRMVLSDISERRKAQAEQARLRQTLLETNAELESANGPAGAAARERSDCIVEISRELDTRLHAILGSLRATCSPPLTEEQKQSMEQIQSAGRFLSNLIGDQRDPAVCEAAKAAG